MYISTTGVGNCCQKARVLDYGAMRSVFKIVFLVSVEKFWLQIHINSKMEVDVRVLPIKV